MRELEFWDEIKGIGVLNLEMELVVGVEPVLFTCSLEDNPEKKYLIMTYNSFKGKYVIREIDNQELLLMLDNEITMEQTFRNAKEIIMTYLESGVLHTQRYNSDAFDEKLLPRKGAYYNIHSKYILDYKEELRTERFSFNLEDALYTMELLERVDENNILEEDGVQDEVNFEVTKIKRMYLRGGSFDWPRESYHVLNNNYVA